MGVIDCYNKLHTDILTFATGQLDIRRQLAGNSPSRVAGRAGEG